MKQEERRNSDEEEEEEEEEDDDDRGGRKNDGDDDDDDDDDDIDDVDVDDDNDRERTQRSARDRLNGRRTRNEHRQYFLRTRQASRRESSADREEEDGEEEEGIGEDEYRRHRRRSQRSRTVIDRFSPGHVSSPPRSIARLRSSGGGSRSAAFASGGSGRGSGDRKPDLWKMWIQEEIRAQGPSDFQEWTSSSLFQGREAEASRKLPF